jgi:hypothetical protein
LGSYFCRKFGNFEIILRRPGMPIKTECLVKKGDKKGDKYLEEVRHIVVSGTDEEIGEQLAELGGKTYGVRFASYENEHYAGARRRFYERNWPEMWERIEGVAKVCGGNAEIENERDYSALVYDMSPSSRMGSLGCSAVFFPTAKDSGPLVVRNFDAWERRPAEVFEGNENCQFGRHLYARPFVMEIAPTAKPDKKNKTLSVIAIGGHDLLWPFQDALNDQGLFITTLADRAPPLTQHMAMAGGRNTGLSSRQILLLLATKCANLTEVKNEVLALQPRMDFGLHWLIADAGGNGMVLAVDEHGCFIFIDVKETAGNRPFPVTNHPLYKQAWLQAYKKHNPLEDYDTFNRYNKLAEEIERHRGDYTRKEAETLLENVACAYADPKAAGIQQMATFTAWSVVADLKNKCLHIRFNGGMAGPDRQDPSGNHQRIDWKCKTVGFTCNRPTEPKRSANEAPDFPHAIAGGGAEPNR